MWFNFQHIKLMKEATEGSRPRIKVATCSSAAGRAVCSVYLTTEMRLCALRSQHGLYEYLY